MPPRSASPRQSQVSSNRRAPGSTVASPRRARSRSPPSNDRSASSLNAPHSQMRPPPRKKIKLDPFVSVLDVGSRHVGQQCVTVDLHGFRCLPTAACSTSSPRALGQVACQVALRLLCICSGGPSKETVHQIASADREGTLDLIPNDAAFWPLRLRDEYKLPLSLFAEARRTYASSEAPNAVRFQLRVGINFTSASDYAHIVPAMVPGLDRSASQPAIFSAQLQLQLGSEPWGLSPLTYCRNATTKPTRYGLDATVQMAPGDVPARCKICYCEFDQRAAFLKHWQSLHSDKGKPTLVVGRSLPRLDERSPATRVAPGDARALDNEKHAAASHESDQTATDAQATPSEDLAPITMPEAVGRDEGEPTNRPCQAPMSSTKANFTYDGTSEDQVHRARSSTLSQHPAAGETEEPRRTQTTKAFDLSRLPSAGERASLVSSDNKTGNVGDADPPQLPFEEKPAAPVALDVAIDEVKHAHSSLEANLTLAFQDMVEDIDETHQSLPEDVDDPAASISLDEGANVHIPTEASNEATTRPVAPHDTAKLFERNSAPPTRYKNEPATPKAFHATSQDVYLPQLDDEEWPSSPIVCDDTAGDVRQPQLEREAEPVAPVACDATKDVQQQQLEHVDWPANPVAFDEVETILDVAQQHYENPPITSDVIHEAQQTFEDGIINLDAENACEPQEDHGCGSATPVALDGIVEAWEHDLLQHANENVLTSRDAEDSFAPEPSHRDEPSPSTAEGSHVLESADEENPRAPVAFDNSAKLVSNEVLEVASDDTERRINAAPQYYEDDPRCPWYRIAHTFVLEDYEIPEGDSIPDSPEYESSHGSTDTDDHTLARTLMPDVLNCPEGNSIPTSRENSKLDSITSSVRDLQKDFSEPHNFSDRPPHNSQEDLSESPLRNSQEDCPTSSIHNSQEDCRSSSICGSQDDGQSLSQAGNEVHDDSRSDISQASKDCVESRQSPIADETRNEAYASRRACEEEPCEDERQNEDEPLRYEHENELHGDDRPYEDEPHEDEGPDEDEGPYEDEGPCEDELHEDELHEDELHEYEGPYEDEGPYRDEGPYENEDPHEHEGPYENEDPYEDEPTKPVAHDETRGNVCVPAQAYQDEEHEAESPSSATFGDTAAAQDMEMGLATTRTTRKRASSDEQSESAFGNDACSIPTVAEASPTNLQSRHKSAALDEGLADTIPMPEPESATDEEDRPPSITEASPRSAIPLAKESVLVVIDLVGRSSSPHPTPVTLERKRTPHAPNAVAKSSNALNGSVPEAVNVAAHRKLPTKQSSHKNPSPKRARKKHPVPNVADGVILFSTRSMRPLAEGEDISESDEDIDPVWDIRQHRQHLAKLPYFAPDQVEVLQRFDEELYRHPVLYNGAMKDFIYRFLDLHGVWIKAKPERISFFGVLTMSYRSQDIITTEEVQDFGEYLNSIASQPEVPAPVQRPAHGGDCDICGGDVSLDNQLVCMNPTCVSQYYHETCILYGARLKSEGNWTCDVCLGRRTLTDVTAPPPPVDLGPVDWSSMLRVNRGLLTSTYDWLRSSAAIKTTTTIKAPQELTSPPPPPPPLQDALAATPAVIVRDSQSDEAEWTDGSETSEGSGGISSDNGGYGDYDEEPD